MTRLFLPAGAVLFTFLLLFQPQPCFAADASTTFGKQPNGVWLVSVDESITDHTDANVQGSLAWTIKEIDQSQATVELPGGTRLPVKGTMKIPENVTLRFHRGAVLHVAQTGSLLIFGGIEAGLYTIFSGEGHIAGEPQIRAVYPQWFGAVGNGAHDDTEALQRAIDFACRGHVFLVDLGRGHYRVTKTLNCTNNRQPGTIFRDGLRIVGSSLNGTLLIGQTGSGHAVIDTSGSQWLELHNFRIISGQKNKSTVGIFTGCPKACPQSQNQVYHISIMLHDDMLANDGNGTIGIWNYAAEEHTYQSVYIHANRPVVLWAFNGEAPDADDAKGKFSYPYCYVELLNSPHSLGVTTFAGECFLYSSGGHAPAVTSHCINSLNMQNTYIGMTIGMAKGENTCAFEIYGSMTNLTYSGTIEGHASFARIHGLLRGSNIRATFGGVRNDKAPLLQMGHKGRLQNSDIKFSLEANPHRPLFGLSVRAGEKLTCAIENTTMKTNLEDKWLLPPAPLRVNSKNLIVSNPQTKMIINESVTRLK